MLKIILVLTAVLVLLGAGAWAQEGKPAAPTDARAAWVDFGPDYLVGPGDVLDISVWKDEALTRSVTVLPDGKISFPLIGEVRAGGRTIADLKQEVGQKISAYVPDPTLSVEVKQVNSMLVYVIGRVNTPGRFALNTNVNVMQGLAMAGGLNPFAKRDKIKILRQEGGGKPIIFGFSYDDVVDGIRLEQNIMLRRGDLVVVP
jgi:polysaccharide biosynthesis/export protein